MSVEYIPYKVGWEFTNACNLRCKHCGSSSGKKLPDELTTVEALKLCDDLFALHAEVVTLTGGEPLLREDWFLVAQRLTKNKVIVNMISNGWLIDEALIDKALSSGVCSIGISVDGLKETHDFMRRGGSFARCLATLKLMKKKGLPAVVLTCINRKNIGELTELKKVLYQNGVERWQLQVASLMGNFLEHQELVIEEKDVDIIIDFAYEVMNEGRLKVDLADDIGYFNLKEVAVRQQAHENHCGGIWQGCQAGKELIGIRANGDIYGCVSLRNDQLLEGNVRNTPLSEIWNRPNAFAWNRGLKKEQLTGFCRTCQYGNYCLGGCSCAKLTFRKSLYQNHYCSFRLSMEREMKRIADIADVSQLLQSANQCIEDEFYQLASCYLSQALGKDPENTELIDKICFVSFLMENYQACVEMSEQALRINPQNATAHTGLGLSYARTGRVDEGIDHLKKAIAYADSDFTHPYYDLAVILSEQDRYYEALEILDQGLKKDPAFMNTCAELYESLKGKSQISAANSDGA